MSRVFINEWKRAINTGTVIAVIGVMFCICFDSWNDLVSAMQSAIASGVYTIYEQFRFRRMCRKYIVPVFATLPFAASFCEKERAGGCVYCFQRGNAEIRRCEIYRKYPDGDCVAFGTVLLILSCVRDFQ